MANSLSGRSDPGAEKGEREEGRKGGTLDGATSGEKLLATRDCGGAGGVRSSAEVASPCSLARFGESAR